MTATNREFIDRTLIARTLSVSGGVAHYSVFEAAGVSRARLGYAVKAGRIQRVRNNWFAQLDAPDDAVRSARVGGAATCLTVLKALGIWCVDDLCLHVAVPMHAGHLSAPTDRRVPLGDPARHRVVLHPIPLPYGLPTGAVDTLDAALMQSVICQTRENAIVSLDSALNGRHLTMARLTVLLSELPLTYQRLLRLVDATSQSGLETKARLRLRGRRIRYRTQVMIDRVGRVDLLIGDRLVVELDGRRWHNGAEAFEEDRRRDLELLRQGYIVIRVSYVQVMNRWDEIETVILQLVRNREHRWSTLHRKTA